MAFVIVAIATTIVAGIPLVLAFDRHARGAALVGLSYLYGAGLVWATLFALSLMHVGWTAVTTTSVLVVLSAVMWAVVLLRRGAAPPPAAAVADEPPVTADGVRASAPGHFPSERSGVGRRLAAGETPAPLHWRLAPLVDLATAYTVVTFAMYATIARVWEWDFWAIWGLKARVFLEAGGVDWSFLRSPFNDFAHADYPLLVPLNYTYAALVGGSWDDRCLGLLGVASAAAVLLIVRSLAAREAGAFTASVLTLAATAFVLSRYVGLAEGPFIAYATAAVLFARRAILFDDAAALRHAAILLGLAASTKNEGVALIACVAIAMVFCRRAEVFTESNVLRLWPALAIAAPWLITRAILHLTTDIARGSLVSRVLERLPETPLIVPSLIQWLPDASMWLLMLAGVLIVRPDRRRAERFVFIVVLLQLAMYVAAYFGSPHRVEWHIETSWPRLVRHVATPLLYVVMLALARTFTRGENPAHAEARPELS